MNAKDAIRSLVRMNDYVIRAYLADLSDADLLQRPVPAAHHIAWQLGHLIKAEQDLLQALPGVSGISLPAGWAEQYTKETGAKEPPTGFATKAQYLELYQQSRANFLKVLDNYPDADLDKPVEGPLKDFAPTHGVLFSLIASHPMMHAGQFVVMRRKLGKPVVI